MILNDASAAYKAYSAKASDISRQLNLAGIAIIWIFRIGDKAGGVPFSEMLLLLLGGFALALALDLLQYIYGSIAWASFHRYKELKLRREGLPTTTEFLAPRWINWPSNVFFYSKILLTIVTYCFLLRHIAHALL